jgi:hypothetical protein
MGDLHPTHVPAGEAAPAREEPKLNKPVDEGHVDTGTLGDVLAIETI